MACRKSKEALSESAGSEKSAASMADFRNRIHDYLGDFLSRISRIHPRRMFQKNRGF
jgi:hypothetical protein